MTVCVPFSEMSVPGRAERQNLKDIREGKRQACEAVICQNYQAIYRFVVYLSGDVSLAEDLTQETFVSAWSNIDKYKGQASLRTWLHKIAYHKFIDSKRKLERQAALIDKLKQESRDVPETLEPLCRVTADEHLHLLYEAMRKLKSSEYLMIVLHYIQDLSFRQMAEVLDEPSGTVKWRTSRALKRLKEFLTGRV